jgi:hypothetical protein
MKVLNALPLVLLTPMLRVQMISCRNSAVHSCTRNMLAYQAEMVNLQKLKFDGHFLSLLDKGSTLHTEGEATVLPVIPL